MALLVELALAERDSNNASVFLCVCLPKWSSWSKAFLAETVETGDTNRDDFHCMQITLKMSMRSIFRR